MEEDDLAVEAPVYGEPCPRCLEPVPRWAARCPNCNEPISAIRRMAPIMAGIAGVLALIFMCVVAYRMVYVPVTEQVAPADNPVPTDGSFLPPPETSSEHETPPPATDSQPVAPAEVPKKAPLDR